MTPCPGPTATLGADAHPPAPRVRPAVPSTPDTIPAPAELVAFGVGFAQKLLTDQHDFVKSLLDAAAPLIPQPAKKVKAAPKAKATAAA